MNGKLVFAMAVLCAVMLATDGLRLRIRGRRIWRRIKKPVCRAACTYTCTAVTSGSAAPVCGLGCRKACDRKRRSPDPEVIDSSKVVIPLPRDFDLYDSNKDGAIQKEEFADLIGLDVSRDDVEEAFSLADSDGDYLITETELSEAPWTFIDDDIDLAPPFVEEE